MDGNVNKKKGFTLIELLVTVGVLALISIIGVVTIISINKKMEEKSNDININNIKSASVSYVNEFKMDSKYWYMLNNDMDKEYACVTLGQLINKGSLKLSVLDTNYNGKKLSRDTSIMIKRDRNTKVIIDEDLELDNTNCLDDSSVSILFDIEGTMGENNYYISSPIVKLNIINEQEIDNSQSVYKIINDNNVISNNFSSKTITINEEGKNINLCVDVVTNKGNNKSFCIKKENEEKLKIDKTPPTMPNLILSKNNNYYILSNGSEDNITNSSDIRYYVDNDISVGSYNFNIREEETNKEINIYTKDDAGNKSNTISKILSVIPSRSSDITINKKYYCEQNNTYYDTESDAINNCKKEEVGNYTTSTEYCCSYNNNVTKCFSSRSSAENYCTKTGSTTTEYSCPSGYSLSGSMCYKTSNTSASDKYILDCDAKTTYSWKTSSTTKVSSCTASSSSCSSKSHVGNTSVSCSNTTSTKTFNTSSACSSYSGCLGPCESTDSGGTSKKYYCNVRSYNKTTKTCTATTGSSVYSVGSMWDKTSATCSGTLTEKSYVDGCAQSVGKSCSSSNKCNRTTTYTCTVSTNASVSGYLCSLDGKVYSNKSSCSDYGTVSSSKSYYCDNVEYNSSSSAISACTKEVVGNVNLEEAYSCLLTNTSSNDKNKEINNCTNYCAKGEYNNNYCYNLT